MVDQILNYPARRENKLGYRDILYLTIGQNKEYI